MPFQYPGNLNTVLDWAIENDVVAYGKRSKVWGKFLTDTAYLRLFNQKMKFLVYTPIN